MEVLSSLGDLVVGLVAGVLAGLFGVGGGIILVPALVIVLGVTQHVAQGVSLVAIVPTAVVGTVTNYRRGNVAVRVAVGVGVTSIVGAVIGAQLTAVVPADLLRRAFGALLILVAVNLLRRH
jgi:uncharacterized membrane protein YfcA